MPSRRGQFMRSSLVIVMAALLAASSPLRADDAVDYLKHIKPLLAARCIACHGVLKQEAGLRLDTGELVRKGAESGPVIAPVIATVTAPATEPNNAPGNVSQSPIIQRVTATDLDRRMPPEGEPLTELQIQQLSHWLQSGAPSPADERPERDPREHWAFQTIQKPTPPQLPTQWGRNPIDAFVAAGHVAQGLEPQSPAQRLELIRRLTIDLTGLPPTLDDWNLAAQDTSEGWYERLVERLLDDPRYGQRWARHWMDVWRYSDWWGLGDQLRNSQMHMWHWRDWIVESLNSDLPYSDMVRLMLAADELAPTDQDKLRATGYLARNYFLFNRNQWMDETVEHVGKGLLGLTMNCAKCHDHKYDPIEQADYYRLRAFFEPYHVRMDMLPGQLDLARDGLPRIYESQTESPTYLFIRGQEAQPDKSKVIAPGVPAIVAFNEINRRSIEPCQLPAVAWQPERQSFVAEAYKQAAEQRIDAAKKAFTKAEQRLRDLRAAHDKSPASSPANDQIDPTASSLAPLAVEPFADAFENLNEQHWRILDGQWIHDGGLLKQLRDGPTRSILRLLPPAPSDFEVSLKFTILGGSQWRSVCLSFDAGSDALDSATQSATPNDTLQTVYVSAVSGGSKLQGSVNRSGRWEYPADASVPRPIPLDTELTLRLLVRGNLINAYLNDEFVLAWKSPLERKPGSIQLETFDALAAFRSFQLKTLPPTTELRQPSGQTQDATRQLASAEEELQFALRDQQIAEQERELLSLQLTAMRADWELQDAASATDEQRATNQQRAVQTHHQAIALARQLDVIRSQRTLDGLESTLKDQTGAKRSATEKQIKATRETLEKAQKVVGEEIKPSDKAAAISGAKWTATRFLNSGADDPPVTFGPKSSGRRSALAAWIIDERNPLTARVAVNHIWTRHFGTSLVDTPFDFGRKTAEPRHRRLLDWLAAEFMESGWSIKHMHRLILNSETYRLSSSVADRSENVDKDPDNHWLWRRQAIRIESQVVRDGILALAGTLDSSAGGPPIMPGDQANSRRRSLYFFHSNNERNLFLTTFDEAAVKECYSREQSIVPQQALALTNSQLVLDASKPIAEKIAKSVEQQREQQREAQREPSTSASGTGDDGLFVLEAFRVILGFVPSEAELSTSQQAMADWRTMGDSQNRGPHELMVWALLNHNDFVTLR